MEENWPGGYAQLKKRRWWVYSIEEIPMPYIPMDLEGASGLPFGGSLWDFLPPEIQEKILHEKQRLEAEEQMEKDRRLHKERMEQVFRGTSESGI